MRDYSLDNRRYVIAGVAVLIVVVYIIRLFMLQITSDDYKKSADSNAFLKKIEYPARGGIYDRNGKLLVFNQPAYDIMVVMNEAKDHLDTLDTPQLLLITSLNAQLTYIVARLIIVVCLDVGRRHLSHISQHMSSHRIFILPDGTMLDIKARKTEHLFLKHGEVGLGQLVHEHLLGEA